MQKKKTTSFRYLHLLLNILLQRDQAANNRVVIASIRHLEIKKMNMSLQMMKTKNKNNKSRRIPKKTKQSILVQYALYSENIDFKY